MEVNLNSLVDSCGTNLLNFYSRKIDGNERQFGGLFILICRERSRQGITPVTNVQAGGLEGSLLEWIRLTDRPTDEDSIKEQNVGVEGRKKVKFCRA